jgi:hypothetical protein
LNAKKPVRKWEKRWILQPSIIESGEVWIQKWVCVQNLTTKVVSDNTNFNEHALGHNDQENKAHAYSSSSETELLLPNITPALINFSEF